MKIKTMTIGLAVGLVCLLVGCAALMSNNLGMGEYESKCATCHGVSAKGDGPKAQSLPIKPADLTMLAKENGGVFPAQHVYEVIDGRVEVAAHGTREMPIWGLDLQLVAQSEIQQPSEEPDVLKESDVRDKIKSIVDYLSRLQDTK